MSRTWLFGLRTFVKTVCVIAGVAFVLLGLMIARAYLGGETDLYYAVPVARLTVNSARASGWVHRGIPGGDLFVTLDVPHHRQSYHFFFASDRQNPGNRVHGCAEWTAPRFPVFEEGDYGPPCTGWVDKLDRGLVAKPGLIEFNADDGRRVRVRW